MRRTSEGTIFFNPQENVYIDDASFAVGLRGTSGGWDWDISNVIGKNNFHYFGYKTFNASLMPVSSLQAAKTDFDDGGFNFLQNTANIDISKHINSVASGLTVSFGGEFRFEEYILYAG